MVRSTAASAPSATDTTAIVWPGSARSSTSASGQGSLGGAQVPDPRGVVGGEPLARHSERRADHAGGPAVQPGDHQVVDVLGADPGFVEGGGECLAGQGDEGLLAEPLLPLPGGRHHRGPATGRGTRRWPPPPRASRPPRLRERKGRRPTRRPIGSPRRRRPARCAGRTRRRGWGAPRPERAAVRSAAHDERTDPQTS